MAERPINNDGNKYYVQDRRSYVGNNILWWADGGGYTTNLAKAEIFSEERAFRLNRDRETDIPWPKDYIDCRVSSVVDVQRTDIKAALMGSGRKLDWLSL